MRVTIDDGSITLANRKTVTFNHVFAFCRQWLNPPALLPSFVVLQMTVTVTVAADGGQWLLMTATFALDGRK